MRDRYTIVRILVRADTHERDRLFSMKKTVEETYGFTQKLEIKTKKPLPIKQRSIAEYLR